MKSYYILGLAFLAFSILACKKNDATKLVPIPNPTTPVIPKDTTATNPVVAKGKTVVVGTGSGNLVVNGATLTLNCNDRIKITKGNYKSISIQNIQAADGCPITITNDGLVELSGNGSQMSLTNLNNVIISGNGDASIKYGFQFHDNNTRSILITKPYNNVTFQNASFKNISDWVIIFNNQSTQYNGTQASYSRNLKFLNIYGENTSRLFSFPGSAENGNINGLIRGLEIAYLDYKNSNNVGNIAWVGNVEDYDIHNNRIDNINANNNEHNGIFQMMGNGKFYDNYISNHQGNAIRAWAYSIGSTPKSVLIYNNIVVNSRKYSAFEVQTISTYVNAALTYVHAKIYNNTCGNLNLSKDWYGSVVDVYTLQGGTCQVYNNIGFNFPAANPSNKTINQQGPTKATDSGNLYFNSSNEVGFANTTTWTLNANSPAKNKGVADASLTQDYYNKTRNAAAPSIGAVE